MNKQFEQPKTKDRNKENDQEVLGHHDSPTCKLG
jgi:hypothetical protein